MKSSIYKRACCVAIFAVTSLSGTHAQDQVETKNASFTYAEFRAGYGLTIFGNGLKERYNAGNFSNSGGGLASLAAYHKFRRLPSVVMGLKYKSLGAGPASGDHGQEMFFNYWGAALAAK
jgi:hypothetical protein